MSWVLWGLTAVLFAEVARFLRLEVERRRAVDANAFPGDPRRAARLSPAVLASSDQAEFGRGFGLLVRVDLALAGLIAAVAFPTFRALGGFALGKGLLFWTLLALGPAQLVFLVPALLIATNTGQSRAARALVQGSVPAFILSALCGAWLAVVPRAPAVAATPIPAASAAPVPVAPSPGAPNLYGDRMFSLEIPPGWEQYGLRDWARDYWALFSPAPPRLGGPRSAVKIFVGFRPYDESLGLTTERFFNSLSAQAVGHPAVTGPAILGDMEARTIDVGATQDGERVRAYAVRARGGYFYVDCRSPVMEFATVEDACGMVARSLMPAKEPKLFVSQPN